MKGCYVMKKCEKTKKVEYLIVSVIICMVFVPKAFQHTAMCLAALMWLLYIFYQYLKEKNKVKFKQPEVKPDVEKLLIYQMRLRISEKLKSFFPDADFVTEDRNIYDLAVNRKALCMCTTGTDEYTHANIVMDEKGMLSLQMFRLISMEPDKSFDINKWFSLEGQMTLTNIITDLNSRGCSRLAIDENGNVMINDNGKKIKSNSIKGFPPKNEWENLKLFVEKMGIKTQITDDSISLAW